ncbi:MAG TPA: cytochrome b/b6 domain-containing protein [Hydrogenophaga sp.]|uniref:cytochrome b/b6 domain-containing protein n=1 Tax=Hydrogenophaga sp. TaxID=1904254 RepID=UPI002BB90905|nr:cytochrome b/b6 domain-containing protein [Hydrogenophaga sp.]HMN92076.1 cytochrome b/b6 domain-containing protein [Hydrogenophaga sp.]HMP11741.1 cytochrome b/b6 domain-containing protein [Hydrogenophaga sp.]
MTQKRRIWDLPTRLFHWALVACVLGLVVTGNVGGSWMNWHLRLGYAVFALLLFRLVWGFAGGHWSRFSRFLPGPAALLRQLRGKARPHERAGHTPLGALSVFAMLLTLAAQVGSGLMSDDEIAFFGPWVGLVSSETVRSATWYHTEVGKLLILGLVLLHLLAIAAHRIFRKERLVGPMLHGDKALPESLPSSRDDLRSRLGALVVLLVCVAVVYGAVGLGSSAF